MKYDRNSLKQAIFKILPKFGEAELAGVYMNIPQMLSSVSDKVFVDTLATEYNPSFDERMAVFICQEAMRDLHKEGYVIFGEMSYTFNEGEQL